MGIDISGMHTALVDASGVMYTDAGMVPGVSRVISTLQDRGVRVIAATNNTSHSPEVIRARLLENGVDIGESDIWSSGLGLQYDPVLRPLVDGASVFVYGKSHSRWYVEAAGGHCVESEDEADCVVIAASLRVDNEAKLARLVAALVRRPEVPVICVNPDLFVMGTDGVRVPVCGSSAVVVEDQVSNPFYWFGKPLVNYSTMIAWLLMERFSVGVDAGVWFFDDNPENVVAMRRDIGVTGCLVRDTGLALDFGGEFEDPAIGSFGELLD